MDSKMELLIELHEKIEEYSKVEDILQSIGNSTKWEEINLSKEEIASLASIEFNSYTINGIEKILKDRMIALFFDFFALVDGVGDPRLRKTKEPWLGFKLENKTLDNDREDEEFLHDMLYEANSKWEEIKNGEK